jgi:xanthine dehydrogenase accessory factor
VDIDLLNRLNQARSARIAAIVLTDTATGGTRLLTEADPIDQHPLNSDIKDRFASGKSGMLADGSTLVTVHLPPPRLVVIGAVHISQALAPMAALAGFDVSIIDPRTAFATAERFGSVKLFAEWPDVVLPRIGLDRHSALAALTHDPKIDDGPLIAAIKARCFYIGALGSKKTHAKRLARLRESGATEAELQGIHAPIGLKISAASPAEIAVAILAEIIQDRHRGSDLAAGEAA